MRARAHVVGAAGHGHGRAAVVVVVVPVMVVVVVGVVRRQVLVLPHRDVLLVVVVLPRPRGDRETHGSSDVWWNALC